MARNILLRLTGDPSDAQSALRDVASDLRAFSREDATAELHLDAKQVREELARTKGALKGLSGEGRIDIQTANAEQNVKRIQDRIDRLRGGEFSVKVGGQLSRAIRELEQAEQTVDKLKDRRVAIQFEVLTAPLAQAIRELEHAADLAKIHGKVDLDIEAALAKARLVKVEVDRATRGEGHTPFKTLERDVQSVVGDIANLASESVSVFGKLGQAAASAGGAASSAFSSIGSSVAGVGSKLAALGPVGIASILGILAAVGPLAPFLLGLVAAVGALVAVLASATIGAAALGVALLGVFGPIALVIFEVVSRIKDLVSASSKVNAAQQAVVVATNAQRNAQTQLKAAQESQAQAAVQGEQAKRDAILGVRDAYLAVESAKLGVTDAKLAVLDADKALSDFNKTAGPTGVTLGSLFKKFKDVDSGKLPGIVDGLVKTGKVSADQGLQYLHLTENLAHAHLQTQIAANAEAHATNSQADAQAKANEFIKGGLNAYPAYAAATDQVAKAQQKLADTTQKLGVAQDKLKRLGGFTPAHAIEKEFQDLFHKIGSDLETLFQPIVAKVLSGVNVLLGALDKIVKNPAVQTGLRAIGSALGLVFRLLGQSLGSPAVIAAISELAKGGASLIRTLAPVLPLLLKFLLAIATEALPALLGGAKSLSGGFQSFVEGELKAGKLHKQIKNALKSLSDLGGLAKAALSVLGDFFSSGVGPGQSLVKHATHLLDKLDRILNTTKGREDLKTFFASAVDSVRTLWHLMQDILKVMSAIAGVHDGLTGSKQPAHPNTTATKIGKAVPLPGPVGGAGQIGDTIVKLLGGTPDNSFIGFHFGDGGLVRSATRGVVGEAGPEAVLPLRPDVLGQLGRAIAPNVKNVHHLVPGGGGGKVRDVHLNVQSPPGTWPALEHTVAVLEQRMIAIGA